VKNNYVLLVVLVACIGGLASVYAQNDSDSPFGTGQEGESERLWPLSEDMFERLFTLDKDELRQSFSLSEDEYERFWPLSKDKFKKLWSLNEDEFKQLWALIEDKFKKLWALSEDDSEQLFAANVHIVLLNERIYDLRSENQALEDRLEGYGTKETRELMIEQYRHSRSLYDEVDKQKRSLQSEYDILSAEKTNLEAIISDIQNTIKGLE
jgi:hypothetical protein